MSWTEIQEVDGGVTIDVGGVGAEIKVTEAPKPKKVKIKADPVNSPEHYKVGGIETIDFIEAKGLGYNLGNVVKYISRADHKDDKLENLKKAQWYLNREVGKLEEK
jgi:hypothetical protein